MTNREEATMKRNASCCAFLDKNTAIFENDVAFNTIYNKMKADTANTNDAAVLTAADNTGYSLEKVKAKTIVSETASKLCGNAQIKFEELENWILYNMLQSTKRYYFGVSDTLTLSRAQKVKDIMKANLLQITAEYVTTQQLIDFQAEIDDLMAWQGKSTNMIAVSPVTTATFKKHLKLTSKDIVVIKKLVKNFKETDLEFHEGVLKNCKTPAAKVMHTKVSFTMIEAHSGKKLEKVVGNLSNSKQMPVSDNKGVMLYQNVKRGKAIATFKLDSFEEQSKEIWILVGKDNKFIVKMDRKILDSKKEL